MTASKQRVRFTGWESDEFVAFANWIAESQYKCEVEVVGREPILATPVRIHGEPLVGHWDGYRRVIEVRTADGTIYEIGGSNSTRPIASTLVVYEGVLPSAEVKSKRDLFRLVAAASSDEELFPLLIARRIGLIADEYVSDLVRTIDAATLPPGEMSTVLRLAGTLEDIAVIPLLTQALSSPYKNIRQLAGLRFRAFEPIFKSYGETAPDCSRAIDALADHVRSDSDWETRTYAAEDLGYFNNSGALTSLEDALMHDSHRDVRWASAIALGRTNSPNVGPLLLSVASQDETPQVQRACLLGLSRLVPAIADAGARDLLVNISALALEHLQQDQSQTSDFAAALIGELTYHGALRLIENEVAISDLADRLILNTRRGDYATKASSAYALGRYVAAVRISPAIKVSAIETISGLDLPAAHGWPDSAYRQWYLAEAAELMSRLEVHDKAAEIYSLAADCSSARPWSSGYLRALSQYERGEAFLPTDLHNALRSLEQSVATLTEVIGEAERASEEAETIDGIDLRRVLASSRAGTVQGVLATQAAGRASDIWQVAKRYFDSAANDLKRLDLLGTDDLTLRLTASERNLILGMLTVAEIGSAACHLWLSLRSRDATSPASIDGLFDDIDSLVEALDLAAGNAHSEGLLSLAKSVADAAEPLTNAGATSGLNRPSRHIRGLLRSLVGPMPRPGMCPLLASGQASLSVNGIGAVSGDGSHDFPFEFQEGDPVSFDVTVAVGRRGRGDVLRLCVEDAPPGASNAEQLVQVHENYFSLRPMELERAACSVAPRYVTFSLAFQTTGCRVETDRRVVWFRGVPRQTSETRRTGEVTKLHESIRRREYQIEELQRAIAADRNVSGAHLQLRQLQADLHRDRAGLAAFADER